VILRITGTLEREATNHALLLAEWKVKWPPEKLKTQFGSFLGERIRSPGFEMISSPKGPSAST
jgi:hypothetical protein